MHVMNLEERLMAEKQSILLVDDEPNVLSALHRLLHPLDCDISAVESAEEALKLLACSSFDVIISDVRMPGMSGIDLLSECAAKYPDTERLLLTGYADLDNTIVAINRGKVSYYIEKPWNNEQVLVLVKNALLITDLREHNQNLQKVVYRQNEELKSLNSDLFRKVEERTHELLESKKEIEKKHQDLKDGYRNTVELLVSLLEKRLHLDSEKEQEQVRIARQVGLTVGLDDTEQKALYYAGRLRRLGQIGFSDELLQLSYQHMNSNERREYRQYPALGGAMLMGLPPLSSAADVIVQHREHMDGKGFPSKLEGEEISLPARILGVVGDYFDFCNGAPGEECLSSADALAQLEACAGSQYDIHVLAALRYLVESDSAIEQEDHCILSTGLQAGQRLSRDLRNSTGTLLLAKDSKLDEALITKLMKVEHTLSEQFRVFVYVD